MDEQWRGEERGKVLCTKDSHAMARREYSAWGYVTLKYVFVFYTEKS